MDSAGSVVSEVQAENAGKLWAAIRSVNSNTDMSPQPGAAQGFGGVFGRLLQIRCMPPIVALQLLTCLSPHCDVERLFSTLISSGPSAGYIPHLGLDSGPRAFWSFSIHYYYLSMGGPDVYEGQVSGRFHDKREGQSICRGTAVVAFIPAFSQGFLAPTPDVPWRLVVISTNQFALGWGDVTARTGPETYLVAILHELTWARRSLRHASNEISSIAAPSDQFLFDKSLRGSLLFEDESYSSSQTYFWALEALRAVNECIAYLTSAWRVHEQALLTSLLQDDEEEAGNSTTGSDRRAPNPYLLQIAEQIGLLQDLVKANNGKQEEIRSLRDGLFNASAVVEARTSVRQGRNVELLTNIAALFLPASFVTSVFGMEGVIPSSWGGSDFGVIFGVVCGVTYLIILALRFRIVTVSSAKFWGMIRRMKGRGKTGAPTDLEKGE